MVFSPDLLDRLEALDPAPWSGVGHRHMFAGRPPDSENTRGARWNPAGTAAIYLSTTRDGALAEAEHQLSLQVPRPKARRTLYEIDVSLSNTLDLTPLDVLDDIGIGTDELEDATMTACQAVGGAAAWLGHDGIQVPSARSSAANLVIYAANRAAAEVFEVVGEEEIPV